jgi:hypothetical protein
LLRRVEETTEIIERKEKEYHSHGNELVERKRQVEQILLELSSTLTDVTNQKKKVADRDLYVLSLYSCDMLANLHSLSLRHQVSVPLLLPCL